MFPINPILAAAVVNIAVGWLLFSKFCFGPMWAKLHGQNVNMHKDLFIRIAAELVSSLMMASALYLTILTFQKSQMLIPNEMMTRMYSWFFTDIHQTQFDVMSSLKCAGFILIGFFVPASLSSTVWCSTDIKWMKIAIKTVTKAVQLGFMATTIALLA